MKIFGTDYHVNQKRSSAAQSALIRPLQTVTEAELIKITPADVKEIARYQPLIFFGTDLPRELLNPSMRIVWIPMWERYARKPPQWWKAYAQYRIRIVSYSRHLTGIVQKAGLDCFELRYFDNPHDLDEVRWEDGLRVLYWNRGALLTKQHVEKLCRQLNVETLYYRASFAEVISVSTRFELPDHIGTTNVVTLPDTMPPKDYLQIVGKANLFFAPRWHEGIGLTVTEALASGCVVLANNAPTMNEYIVHGQTGLFIPYSKVRRFIARAKARIERRWRMDRPQFPVLQSSYDWREIQQYDLPAISSNARQQSITGFQNFMAKIPDLIDFMLNW